MAEAKMGHVLNRGHVVEMAADVLRVADAALSAVTAGHAEARRLALAGDHYAREEFLTDLFSGRADVASLVERAERIGLQLAVPHFTVVVDVGSGFGEIVRPIQSALRSSAGWSSPLVLHRQQLVAIVAAVSSTPSAVKTALGRVHGQQVAGGAPCWRAGVGRVRHGLRGIQVSYQDAREAVELATRLGATDHIVSLDQLLLYRALTRDRGAIADLIRAVLEPLTRSRHGAQPLLETLDAYFTAGCVTTHAARLLHLSVRAVSYRFARIQRLTGYDVDVPTDRLALHMAVMGARMLRWPTEPLPDSD
jgi:sugar diacid utilization regulator